ncbi:MAG: diaminopimelate decarboxylase [Phycisphaerae bacterium]|nr:diaminopimelate decarboxylase [Phycisphaerae bacterium]
MDHFAYRQGELYCENVPVCQIAEAVGTPAYIYSKATLLHHFRQVRDGFAEVNPTICFSIKSCQNIHILQLLAQEGAGFDVVSGGELFRARQAGADMARIVFAGVGKRDVEIEQAIKAGIGWFNVESEAELVNLQRVAALLGATVRAALRINPDVDPKTHTYTTTGKKETKFGVDLERAMNVFQESVRQPNVRLCGLHLHIGSPVNTVQPYVEAVTKALLFIDELRVAGFQIEALNIGGGFGASYSTDEAPTATDYARAIVPLLHGKRLSILTEPGRSIAANAGILVAQVLLVKQSGERQFAIVDAAMTDLIRPALYGAYHFAWPVRPGEDFCPERRGADLKLAGTVEMDIVGPVCESGDFLAKGRHLPPVQRGDYMAVFTAGAYGFVMSSQYNSRPRAPEVLVDGAAYAIIRRRETYEDLVGPEYV